MEVIKVFMIAGLIASMQIIDVENVENFDSQTAPWMMIKAHQNQRNCEATVECSDAALLQPSIESWKWFDHFQKTRQNSQEQGGDMWWQHLGDLYFQAHHWIPGTNFVQSPEIPVHSPVVNAFGESCGFQYVFMLSSSSFV